MASLVSQKTTTARPGRLFLISQIKQGAKLLSWFPFFDISHKVLHTESCSHVLKNSRIVLLMESDAFSYPGSDLCRVPGDNSMAESQADKLDYSRLCKSPLPRHGLASFLGGRRRRPCWWGRHGGRTGWVGCGGGKGTALFCSVVGARCTLSGRARRRRRAAALGRERAAQARPGQARLKAHPLGPARPGPARPGHPAQSSKVSQWTWKPCSAAATSASRCSPPLPPKSRACLQEAHTQPEAGAAGGGRGGEGPRRRPAPDRVLLCRWWGRGCRSCPRPGSRRFAEENLQKSQ